MKKRNTIQTSAAKGMLSLAAVATGLSILAAAAFADDPTTMAPPIQSDAAVSLGSNASANASADTVFNWQEIPASQQVPLTRAAFDQGGYQLYDTVGETIIVPFTNQNLYVMKFAQSSNGKLYFENAGDYPILYVPKGAYLENATVAGARWYPFGEDFHPSEPVFLGIAPSYPEFIDLGWYPNTCFYGGYYGRTSFLEGGLFLPTVGLFFSIGGHPYYGWHAYHDYYFDHPGFYHTGYYNRDFYHFAGRPGGFSRSFNGTGRPFYAHRTFGGGPNGFGGRENVNVHQNYNVHQNVNVHQNYNVHQNVGGVRTFRGTSNFGQSDHILNGSRGYSARQGFSGHQEPAGSSGSSGRTFHGGSGFRQSFGQNTRSYSSGSQNDSRPQNFVGGRSSQGGSSSGQNSRSYGGGSQGGGQRGGGGGGFRGGGGGGRR